MKTDEDAPKTQARILTPVHRIYLPIPTFVHSQTSCLRALWRHEQMNKVKTNTRRAPAMKSSQMNMKASCRKRMDMIGGDIFRHTLQDSSSIPSSWPI